MSKPYWIKERHNPQIGVYYVACGQLSRKEAKAKEQAAYGHNVMLRFDDEKSYRDKLDALRLEGLSVHT